MNKTSSNLYIHLRFTSSQFGWVVFKHVQVYVQSACTYIHKDVLVHYVVIYMVSSRETKCNVSSVIVFFVTQTAFTRAPFLHSFFLRMYQIIDLSIYSDFQTNKKLWTSYWEVDWKATKSKSSTWKIFYLLYLSNEERTGLFKAIYELLSYIWVFENGQWIWTRWNSCDS